MAYVLARLIIATDGARCAFSITEHLIDNHSDGAYEVMRFAVDCPAAPRVLTIKYALFFDLDPQHRGLLRLEEQGRTHTAVFSPDRETWQLEGQSVGLREPISRLFRDRKVPSISGPKASTTSYSSAPCCFPLCSSTVAGDAQAVATFRKAFLDVISIVTAFTIAHSITLSLAVLGFVTLPSRLIESTIAASVVVAALNNVAPLIEKRLWIVAFVFGLVHGLGFANVLTGSRLCRSLRWRYRW